jgi:hypothetical protein
VSIQQLTAEHFGGRSAADFGPGQDRVVLDSVVPGASVLLAMPDFAAPVPPGAED